MFCKRRNFSLVFLSYSQRRSLSPKHTSSTSNFFLSLSFSLLLYKYMYIGEQQQQRAQKLLNCARAFTLRAYLAKATLFKNSFVQKTASSVQRTQKSFALVSIKNSKKQQTNFTEQTERNQRKKYTKTKKSVGKALDASSLCCADLYIHRALTIKCSRHSREEGLPLRNEEDIEAFSEVVLSKTLKKKQTTTTLF